MIFALRGKIAVLDRGGWQAAAIVCPVSTRETRRFVCLALDNPFSFITAASVTTRLTSITPTVPSLVADVISSKVADIVV
jgi:hypothetical protein